MSADSVTQPLVSIIIPIAPYHEAIASEAIASAHAQTVSCTVLEVHDTDGIGAGAARNAGLAQVTTPFVVFLDADDLLAPTFAEDCLKVWTPNHYIYTDWMNDDTAVEAPDCPWTKGFWHVNTTLQVTEWVKAMGGYDEHLPGAEDTDYFYRLTRAGCCGTHLRLPLFTYRAGGKRAESFVYGEHHIQVLEAIRDKYRSYPMGCCGGDKPQTEAVPANEAQPGYVLVQALWHGNHREWIEYFQTPRTSYPRTFYMPEEIVGMRPDLVRLVAQPNAPQAYTPPANGSVYPKQTVADLGAKLFGKPVPQQAPPQKPTAETAQQIIERARKVWNE